MFPPPGVRHPGQIEGLGLRTVARAPWAVLNTAQLSLLDWPGAGPQWEEEKQRAGPHGEGELRPT